MVPRTVRYRTSIPSPSSVDLSKVITPNGHRYSLAQLRSPNNRNSISDLQSIPETDERSEKKDLIQDPVELVPETATEVTLRVDVRSCANPE